MRKKTSLTLAVVLSVATCGQALLALSVMAEEPKKIPEAKKPATSEATAGKKAAAGKLETEVTDELAKRYMNWAKVEKLLPGALAEVRKTHGSTILMLRDMDDLAVHYESERNAVRALEMHKQMLDLDKEQRGLSTEARMQKLADVGRLLYLQGKYADALSYYNDAVTKQLAAPPTINSLQSSVEYLGGQALVLARLKDAAKAAEAANKAVSIADGSKAKDKGKWQATAYRNAGNVFLITGDLAKAQSFFEKALPLDKNKLIASLNDEPLDLLGLCQVAMAKKDNAKAESYLKQAMLLVTKYGDNVYYMLGPTLLWASLYQGQGKTAEADKQYKKAMTLIEQDAATIENVFSMIEPLKAYQQALQKQNRAKDASAVADKLKQYKALCGV